MMSLLMFAAFGLFAVSTALVGALIDLNMTVLFAGAGGLITLVVFLAALNPTVRSIGADRVMAVDQSAA